MIFENITVKSSLLERIKKAQKSDLMVQKYLEKVKKGELLEYKLGPNGMLKFRDRIVVPKDSRLRKKILEETRHYKYTVHPNSNKMYQDLKRLYCWDNMKKEIAQFVQLANRLKPNIRNHRDCYNP